eukprot:NODE_662_length_5423_cov_0.101991.p1 type:complete len:477 gc:universal NODE_662_length_5423_cov_0.101991:3707-5137(+)
MEDTYKTSLVAEADYFYKKSDLPKALELYSKVLAVDSDKHCLLHRGYCYISQASYDLAMKDVETLLKLDQNHYKGLLLKASILFDTGEFEYALILYNGAYRIKCGDEVDTGLFKCKSAILTLFCGSAGASSSIDSDKLIKVHMPDFACDYYFLLSISKKFKDTKDEQFSRIADEGITYMEKRLDFWKNYNHNDKVENKKLKKKATEEIKVIKEKRKLPPIPQKKSITMNASKQSVNKVDTVVLPSPLQEPWKTLPPEELSHEDLCRRIRKSFENEEFQQVKRLCEEFLKRDIKISTRQAAARYCDVLLDYAHGLLELNDSIDHAKSNAAQARNISKVFQLHSYYPRALNILGKCFSKAGRNEKAIKLWEERMKFDSTPLEKAWIYHDLGKCYLDLGKINKSKECARLSLEFSDQMGSRTWSASAKLLLGRCCEAEGYIFDAIGWYEKAVKSSRACGDKIQLSALEHHLIQLRANVK